MISFKRIVKDSFLIFKIYEIIGRILILLSNSLIKDRKNQILFITYGGDKIDDSPYYIYESLKKDGQFSNYTFIWAVNDISSWSQHIKDPRTKLVSSNNPKYFFHLYKSKIWITNTTVFRGLKGKTPENVHYINTWHGTPFKLIGEDYELKTKTNQPFRDNQTIYLTQSPYEEEIYSRAFRSTLKYSVMTGLPRNDILLSKNNKIVIKQIKKRLNIETNKKILLYAPTYREKPTSRYEADKKEMLSALGKKYFILFRGHHADLDNNLFDELKLQDYLNLSNYSEVNDLLLISDVLITDYSSICVDFAILNKPIYFWVYDFEKYEKERGLYFNFFETFKQGIHIEKTKLIKSLLTETNFESGIKNMNIIHNEFLKELGNGTDNTVKLIKKLEKM